MTEIRDWIGSIVGRNIAARRRQLGITDEQFCTCLGVKREVLDSYESGAVRVDARSLLSIGAILDVPPMYFFKNVDESHTTPVSQRIDADFEADRKLFLKEGVALNHAFARIGKSRSRQILIEVAIALAEIDRVPKAAGGATSVVASPSQAARTSSKQA